MADILGSGQRMGQRVGKRVRAAAWARVLTSVWVSLGIAGLARAQVPESPRLDALAQAAQAAPHDVEAQIRYGRALLRAGDVKRAEAQMERAAKLSQNSAEALFEVARVRFTEGDYRRSRAACHALAQAHRGHLLHDVCMARAFLVWRRASRADEPIAAALAKAPEHVEVQFAVAEAARLRSDFDKSEAAYDKVLESDPSYAEAYLGLATLQRLKGDDAAATATLQKGVGMHPENPDLLYQLSLSSPPAEAVKRLRAALAARPHFREAEEALGAALLAAGDTGAAIAQLRAVLKRTPKDGVAMGQLGAALLAQGQVPEAEQTLTRALELQPNHPDAALALARIYARTGRIEEALEGFQKAAGMRLTDSLPLIEAGELAHDKGRNVLATAFVERALERHPLSPRALALRGDVLLARGDREGAADSYRKALAQPASGGSPAHAGALNREREGALDRGREDALDRAAVQKKLQALR